MDPSLVTRSSFWGMTIGQFFLYVSRFTIGQKFIQRFLAIEKEIDIKKYIIFKLMNKIFLFLNLLHLTKF